MIKFKNKKDEKLFWGIHPVLKIIAMDIGNEFRKFGYDCTITSTTRTAAEDKKLGAVSKTHQEGRAIDISVKGMDVFFLDELMDELETKYHFEAAYVYDENKELVKNLIEWHNNGNGDHWHVQIRRGL